MSENIKQYHWTDAEGVPEGGQTFGRGFAIAWQKGPLGRGEFREEPNGAFVEDIIQAAVGRLEFYQNSKFSSDFNRDAPHFLGEALKSLQARTAEREKRKVEGTKVV